MRVSRRLADYLITVAEELLDACQALNLRCRDPPLVTTRLLRRVGAGQYVQRSVFNALKQISASEIVLYRYLKTEFSLSVVVRSGKLMHVDGWVPVDLFDCKAMADRCSSSPRGAAGFVYLVGSVEGSQIRVNAVNLLRLLDISRPGSSRYLLESMRDMLWGRGPDKTLKSLLEVISWPSVRLVLPKVPSTPDELLRLSPALRESLKEIYQGTPM